MSEAAPAIGHNSGDPAPIFDYAAATYAVQAAALAHCALSAERQRGFGRWEEETCREIGDDLMQGRSGDFVKQLGVTIRIIEAARAECKMPALDIGKFVDAEFRILTEPLVKAKSVVETAMTNYARAKVAEQQRQARLAAEAEAQRQREAAEMAAMEAELLGDPTPSEPPPAPVQAPLPSVAEASRTHGDYGTTASLRGRWVHAVTDMNTVPRQYMMVNDAAVKAAIKAGVRDIPGINIFQEQKIGVR